MYKQSFCATKQQDFPKFRTNVLSVCRHISVLCVFTSTVCFLVRVSWWDCKRGASFPFDSVCFPTEKNPSEPKCITTNQMRTFPPLVGLMCQDEGPCSGPVQSPAASCALLHPTCWQEQFSFSCWFHTYNKLQQRGETTLISPPSFI